MACCDKKFWTENLGGLFNSISVIPYTDMSLEQQMNCLTRFVVIIFAIMWLFDFAYSIHFLIFSILFIIIIYYIQRNRMEKYKENYVHMSNGDYSGSINTGSYGKQNYSLVKPQPYNMANLAPQMKVEKDGIKWNHTILNTGQPIPFCNDEVSIDPPSNFAVGLNQSLTRGPGNMDANPNTKISPVVIARSHDLEYWRDNNFITMSQINSSGIQEDMYLSGYAESTCCDYLEPGSELVPRNCQNKPTEYYKQDNRVRENYCPGSINSPSPVVDTPYVPTSRVRENYCPGSINSPSPVVDTPYVPTSRVRENFEQSRDGRYRIIPNQSGWVNTECGYNPEQTLNAGLPSNLPSGNCAQSPLLKNYNENLFTQIITPGNYTRTQVNEPVSSNIGISFQQQFEPTTVNRDENGLHYLEHDPRILEVVDQVPQEPVIDKVNYDNVYDPRFYGYGTSYRSYLEPVTGQTRFMYDDVNAIRMPTYITRSKVDHLPYADSYGPMQAGSEFGNVHNPHMRYLVQDSWLRDSVQFRDDLTQSLMRKNNAMAWQKRQYPNSARPIGVYKK
jgi:hypothetical protein